MKHTVLLVDDSASMVAQLSESIQFHAPEFVVLGASNGQKAIEVLESREIDVLVTDLTMPVMDGFELLGYVKRRKPNLPFVVLSSMPHDRAGWRLSPFGATPFLSKPVHPEKLIEQMRSLLREVSSGRIVGVTLPNLLQLLEWERKSCAVRITTESGKWGRLHFLSGQLVNAYSADDDLEGEQAARRILGWEASDIELERSYHNHERRIERPLQELLLDSAREADEEEARRTGVWPALDIVPPESSEPSNPVEPLEPLPPLETDEPVMPMPVEPLPPLEPDEPVMPMPVEPLPPLEPSEPAMPAEPAPPPVPAEPPAKPVPRPGPTAAPPAPPAPAPPEKAARAAPPEPVEPTPEEALERRIDALAEALEVATRALAEARVELEGLRDVQRTVARERAEV